MGRIVKITEEQRQYALSEGVVLNADVDAANGDVKKAVDTTRQQAQKSGLDPKKTTIQIPPTTEGKVITKKQMIEGRLMKLKENSDFYQLKEFVKCIGKKKVNEGDLTNTQVRNMTGIYDDDELNAAVEAEDAENLEGEVWHSIKQIAGGNPRERSFKFADMAKMLADRYGFKYKGVDEDEEGHVFTNGKYELEIFPDTFYPKQGTMRIYNMHVY